MMELTCAVLLISASLVTATPYGYGVKGGAAAKAESSAAAGSFGGVGDIPVAIPLGASYSGSFSKSSSSSSSSSSASSSSSSSSFSYSGSGANGLGYNGGAHGNGGCSSGSCPNAGGSGVAVPHGSSSGASGAGLNAGALGNGGCSSGSCPSAGDNGVSATHGSTSGAAGYGLNGGAHGNGGCSSGSCSTGGDNAVSIPHGSSSGYNTANAAATAGAGAGALSGPGCQGPSCDGSSEKCTSGQCKPKSPSGSSTGSDSHKCASGQCGSGLEGGVSQGDYGSNDIRVVTDSAHDAKDQSSNIDKTSYNAANSDCSNGNCNTARPLSSKPNYYGAGNSNQGSSAANNHQPSNSNTGVTSHYQKPSTHLETPKLSSKCSSGNCHAEPAGPSGSYDSSPSSYNVPIHGAYNNGAQKPICDGGKCDNQPKGPYSSPNTNTFTTGYQQHSPSADNYVTNGPSYNTPSSNCAGSNCFGSPANQNSGAPTYTPTPAPLNFGQQPSINLPGHAGHTKPTDISKPSADKLPVYTGGFGGPAGVLNPNEFDVAAPTATGHPSHAHGTTPQNGQPSGSYQTGCNSPSCSGYPSAPGSATPSGSYGHKPSGSTPNDKLPTYTGGFGGPAGMLKPNDYAHPGSSSHNTQSPVNNNGITGCKTGNCGAYSPSAGATTGPISPGYSGSTKPNTGINSNEKLPTYTGGFGGPDGVFNPNKYDAHQTGPTSPAHTPSGTYINPTSGGCTTPNCYSPQGSSASANANAHPIGIIKPGSGAHPSTVPSYTGGYQSPSVVNKPNEISATVSGPNYTPTQSQSTPGSHTGGCKTGNCGVYPVSGSSSADAYTQSGSFGVTKPAYANPVNSQYTGGYNDQSGTLQPHQHTPTAGSGAEGCKTPNCVSSPTATGVAISGVNTQSGSNSQTGSYGTTKPSGPTYSGGFGGAPGILNPNDYTIPAVGATPNNKPTGVSKPAACTSGSCSSQHPQGSASHSHNDASNTAHATAAADANAVAYTGGFGGPPGVLEPYDDGKGGAKPAHGGQSHGSHAGGYSSPNANINSAHGTAPGANSGITGPAGVSGAHGNGAHAGSAAGAAAFAGAAAGASAGSHGYNTHGSSYNHAGNTKGGSPCGGGCGGSTGGAYNGGLSGGAHNTGSGYDFSGGLGSPKLGYSDGLTGSGSLSAATAKSLAGANAFGLGGSFASSSASAHASAGAYTKGGYGKR
ncbi:uncharacterized transmembrane protein DDB_G0289901-like [Helicoverpa zea]|uniref:uncharacterized transmembrane protein DDB_G0289901-like n=1 Tax=Helicoverpa zea TaxID=7113 RepID=UPI001F57941D|nr:uncharacterized transmembrane protein DDB_G0289901-like [Helicoverpa zea]